MGENEYAMWSIRSSSMVERLAVKLSQLFAERRIEKPWDNGETLSAYDALGNTVGTPFPGERRRD